VPTRAWVKPEMWERFVAAFERIWIVQTFVQQRLD
jgi:hypothetical protein